MNYILSWKSANQESLYYWDGKKFTKDKSAAYQWAREDLNIVDLICENPRQFKGKKANELKFVNTSLDRYTLLCYQYLNYLDPNLEVPYAGGMPYEEFLNKIKVLDSKTTDLLKLVVKNYKLDPENPENYDVSINRRLIWPVLKMKLSDYSTKSDFNHDIDEQLELFMANAFIKCDHSSNATNHIKFIGSITTNSGSNYVKFGLNEHAVPYIVFLQYYNNCCAYASQRSDLI